MAVYKATHCYPMLNNVDTRIVADAENLQPAEFLKCQIDTSNKDVTGYSIRILDSLNNQIFPYNTASTKISPISELANLETNEDFVNTGLNGSFLHVPFFQNKNTNLYTTTGERVIPSYNAIYYEPTFKAHYFLESSYTSSWVYNSTTHVLENEGWNGVVDGEKALVDEVVLIQSTDSTKGGLWKFQQDGSLTRYSIGGVDLTYTTIQNKGVLILRGTHHNVVYTVNSSWPTNANNKWEDINGNIIANWGNEGNTYKWEITLYQGQGVVTTTTASYVSYDNLETTWYDMILQTGSICGTTPKRLQLGSTNDSSFDAQIPAGTETDPLVLQGRWGQLIDSSGHDIGSRGYIQSYDASYGHAYPLSGSLSISDVESAQKVKFFKYSNKVDEVKSTDIVKCASTENISSMYGYAGEVTETITFFMLTGKPISSSEDPQKITKIIDGIAPEKDDTVLCANVEGYNHPLIYKVTAIAYLGNSKSISAITYTLTENYSSDAYYLIKKGNEFAENVYHNGQRDIYPLPSVQTIDGVQLTEGISILLKNQTNAKENGVYVYHANARWTRSGSYDTWGSFIGKIILVQNGTINGGKNFESLANAGGTLYTGSVVSSGESPLYFTEEKPIVLFPQDIYRNDIDLATETARPASRPSQVDGITITTGMIVYFAGSAAEYGSIVKIVDGSPWYSVLEVLTESKYLYVNDGKKYGHSVIRKTSDTTTDLRTHNLSEAYLLKNTTTRTYISPFIGLKKNMALKLQNNKTAPFTAGASEWIRVNGSINKNTWCIQTSALSSPLKSYSETDKDIPWSYEVRSFYRSSDESIFYCYEKPYLKLTYNGEGYTDLITWEPYTVIEQDQYSEYDVLKNPPPASAFWLRFLVAGASLSAIADRFVTLQGYYNQFQKLSWVSYRWVLTNQNGDILQDTGKKFDKKMEVSFYGLSNEEGSNVYYAILYVEDALKETLTFAVRLIVAPSRPSTLGLPFHATFERQTHSVVLEYDDYGHVMPSVTGFGGVVSPELAYVSSNKGSLPDEYQWDSSVSYDDKNLVITEKGNSPKTTIIDRFKPNSQEIANVSNTIKNGVKYSHYFPSDKLSVQTDSHQLKMQNEEFSLQTEVQLDDNFCGDFLTLDLIDENTEGKYVRLVLFTLPGLSSSSTLNSNRYTVNARLEAVNGTSVVGAVKTSALKTGSGGNSVFYWHEYAQGVDGVYYALQPEASIEKIKASIDNNEYPYKDFQYTILGQSGLYPWYMQSKSGKIRSTSGSIMGNLCLISGSDIVGETVTGEGVKGYCGDSLGYWNEYQQQLKYVKVGSPLSNDYYVTMTTDPGVLGEKNEVQDWPLPNNEINYYWVEQMNNSMTNAAPATWAEVKDSEEIKSSEANIGLIYYDAMPRYYGALSKQAWKIKVDCQKLSALYTALSNSSSISATYIPDIAGGGIQFKIGNTVHCKILLNVIGEE